MKTVFFVLFTTALLGCISFAILAAIETHLFIIGLLSTILIPLGIYLLYLFAKLLKEFK